MKARNTKDIEITKELILPFADRTPAFEQPMLELPLPSHQERPERQEETTKEIALRGVWTVDI